MAFAISCKSEVTQTRNAYCSAPKGCHTLRPLLYLWREEPLSFIINCALSFKVQKEPHSADEVQHSRRVESAVSLNTRCTCAMFSTCYKSCCLPSRHSRWAGSSHGHKAHFQTELKWFKLKLCSSFDRHFRSVDSNQTSFAHICGAQLPIRHKQLFIEVNIDRTMDRSTYPLGSIWIGSGQRTLRNANYHGLFRQSAKFVLV